MMLRRNWLQRLWFNDRRSADRRPSPPLIAHYWTGRPPSAKRIRDISCSGLFLQTEEKWYPRTIVRITLQRVGVPGCSSEQCRTLQAMVVRDEPDGVGFAFILPPIIKGRGRLSDSTLVTDKESLKRFIDEMLEKNIAVHLDPWVD